MMSETFEDFNGFVELTDEEMMTIVGGFDNPNNCSWMHGSTNNAVTDAIGSFFNGFSDEFNLWERTYTPRSGA
jgi:hypothetical protein